MIPGYHFPAPAPEPVEPRRRNAARRTEAEAVAAFDARVRRRLENRTAAAADASGTRVVQRVGGDAERTLIPGAAADAGAAAGTRLVEIDGRPMRITPGSGVGLYLIH